MADLMLTPVRSVRGQLRLPPYYHSMQSHDITPPVHRQLPSSPQRATNGHQRAMAESVNPAPAACTLVVDAAQFEIDLRLVEARLAG